MDEQTQQSIRLHLQNNGYNIVRKLGEGGFGIVYLTTDSSGKEYATKIIHNADEVMRESYEREMLMLQAVSQSKCAKFSAYLHDNFDLMINGQEWNVIVQEFINGPDLSKYLDSRPVALSDADKFNMVVDIARGIQCIHSLGVAHRDIKADNMIIKLDGDKPIIIDFGLACLMYDPQSKTTACYGEALGTYVYMPIEMFTRFLQQYNAPRVLHKVLSHVPVPNSETLCYKDGQCADGVLDNYDYRTYDIWAFAVTIYLIYHYRLPFFPTQLNTFEGSEQQQVMNIDEVLDQMINHNYMLTNDDRINQVLNVSFDTNYKTRATIDDIMQILAQ